MIMDALLVFSTAQALTSAAGSTSTIDFGIAGRDIGTGEDLYVVCVVTTALTDGSSDSTVTVSLEGDSTESFTPDGTHILFTIPALAAIGDTFFAKLDPGHVALQYRYIRLKYAMVNGDLTTGAVTAFITKDISKYKAFADAITIS